MICVAALLYCLGRCCLQLIEKLYRARWTKLDGLGALVLTPTRELALQIFEELVKVEFSDKGLSGRVLRARLVRCSSRAPCHDDKHHSFCWGSGASNDADFHGKPTLKMHVGFVNRGSHLLLLPSFAARAVLICALARHVCCGWSMLLLCVYGL
jgi:hypothetical protein